MPETTIAQRCRVPAVAAVADPTACWPWDAPPISGRAEWLGRIETADPQPLPVVDGWTMDHVGRVRWLIKNGWDDPIEIDVGLGEPDWWPVVDGNHRLVAAILRGDRWILVEPAGLDDANRLLRPETDW